MKFDPMTGEPIMDEVNEKPKMKFDPMTGEPIMVEPEQMQEPIQPQEAIQPQEPVQSVEAGQPVNAAAPKKKTGLIVGISVAAVAVIAAAVVLVINSGIFLSKAGKVAQAVENTFADQGALMEDLDVSSILESNKYTVGIEAEVEGVSVNLDCMVNDAEKQVYGNIDMAGVGTDFTLGLSDGKIMAQIPYVSDKVFTYDYKGKKNGYLAEMVGKDEIKALDTLLEALCEGNGENGMTEELQGAFIEEWESLEFEDAETETFEVDGKDRECKGYTTVITSENVGNVLDVWEDVYMESYTELEQMMEDLGGYAEESVSESFDEIREVFEDMPDMDVTFYIYDKELACISLEADGEEMQLQFLGGDRRMQNMRLELEGATLMEVCGEKDGSNEITELYVDGSCIMTVEYDSKTGEFVLSAGEEEFSVMGSIQSGKKGLFITIDEIYDYGEYMNYTVGVSVESGAKIEEIDGEEFDIGNASQSDWMELVEEISDSLGMYY